MIFEKHKSTCLFFFQAHVDRRECVFWVCCLRMSMNHEEETTSVVGCLWRDTWCGKRGTMEAFKQWEQKYGIDSKRKMYFPYPITKFWENVLFLANTSIRFPCMCVCACMCVSSTCVCISSICVCTCVCVSMCMCISSIHICTCVCVSVCMCISSIRVCTCVCVSVCVCVCISSICVWVYVSPA